MKNQEKMKTESPATMVTLQELGITAPEKRASSHQFAAYVRMLLQNWRQGTVGVKGRADVARTGKKPWKQKGTGRARAGTPRSPLWRGGGVTFGPQPRTRTLQVTKQTKQQVLLSMLVNYVAKKKLVALNWELELDKPKTSHAAALLKNAGLQGKKVILFVSPDDLLTYASFVNIPRVHILFFDQSNAYDCAKGEYWLYLKKDTSAFKEMVALWQ